VAEDVVASLLAASRVDPETIGLARHAACASAPCDIRRDRWRIAVDTRPLTVCDEFAEPERASS
jgi:hypothetical protein